MDSVSSKPDDTMVAASGSDRAEHVSDEKIQPVEQSPIAVEDGNVVTKTDVQRYTEDDDDAMKAFADYNGPPIVLDDATRKRLLRTIDWHLMPLLCFVFALNYLDKTTISYASVMGIKKDINLTGDDYQWLGSIFYLGSLVWEYPTSRLLQLLPLAKYSAFCVMAWGGVLTLFAVVHNFAGAMAIRFFLGLFEAASMPGFALIASQWYTIKEHNTRASIWIGSNGWGQIVGGCVAYGVAKRVGEDGSAIAGWKIIFIAIGLFTTLVGAIFLYVIPDSPLNCRWLSKHDRILAIERVRGNEQGIGNRHFKWHQFREALLDPLTWSFFMYGILHDIPNGGITNFFSQLIVNFGFTPEQSLLYGVPGGAVVILACFFNGFVGDYFRQRLIVACTPLLCALIGMILIIALPISNDVGRLIGYYMTQANPAAYATVLSLVSSNIAGYTKKTSVAAFFVIGYCTGNIIGPQTFRPSQAPRYLSAEVTVVVCYFLGICDLLFIRWWCKRENKRKAGIRAAPGYVPLENIEWRDLTDRENPEFVYAI